MKRKRNNAPSERRRRQKMWKTEVIRLPVDTVENLIAAHLYAVGKLNDDEDVDIGSIVFDPKRGDEKDNQFVIIMNVNKKEVNT
jgi:hypothetical protein